MCALLLHGSLVPVPRLFIVWAERRAWYLLLAHVPIPRNLVKSDACTSKRKYPFGFREISQNLTHAIPGSSFSPRSKEPEYEASSYFGCMCLYVCYMCVLQVRTCMCIGCMCVCLLQVHVHVCVTSVCAWVCYRCVLQMHVCVCLLQVYVHVCVCVSGLHVHVCVLQVHVCVCVLLVRVTVCVLYMCDMKWSVQ